MIRRPPRSTLFPSTPLSRSDERDDPDRSGLERHEPFDVVREPVLRDMARAAVVRDDAHEKPMQARDVVGEDEEQRREPREHEDRKSTRLNSSHSQISYAVFC